MNMCIQFMRCACHKIALFLCGDLTRFELVDFYILRYGTGYVAFIAGTRQYHFLLSGADAAVAVIVALSTGFFVCSRLLQVMYNEECSFLSNSKV